jgi:hypothetical protein
MTRVPHGNDPNLVKDVLGYYDKFAGKDLLDHISQIKEVASGRSDNNVQSLTELLHAFSISVAHEPVTLEAKRITPPSLRFAENNVETNTHMGSWNLNRKGFSRYVLLSLLVL